MYRSFITALVFLSLVAPAYAQQQQPPGDSIQDAAQDWQGLLIAQGHLLKSLQAMATELQAARVRIKELEEQRAKEPPKPK